MLHALVTILVVHAKASVLEHAADTAMLASCFAGQAQGILLPAHPALTSWTLLLLIWLTMPSPRSHDLADLQVSAAQASPTMPFDVVHVGAS